MRLKYTKKGTFKDKGFYFDSNDQETLEQTVPDDAGAYFLSSFPKFFEEVELLAEPEVETPKEVVTTPVTKADLEQKPKNKYSYKIEYEDGSVKEVFYKELKKLGFQNVNTLFSKNKSDSETFKGVKITRINIEENEQPKKKDS